MSELDLKKIAADLSWVTMLHPDVHQNINTLISEVKRLREVLKLEQELRKEATRLTTIFESLINAQKDALNDMMRERRNPLADALHKAFTIRKCMVKGCENKSTEGEFVGDLCASCHQRLTTTGPGFFDLRRIYDAMNLTGEHRCLEGVLAHIAVEAQTQAHLKKYLNEALAALAHQHPASPALAGKVSS